VRLRKTYAFENRTPRGTVAGQSPSSAARALAAGATNIERVDRLVQAIAKQKGMQSTPSMRRSPWSTAGLPPIGASNADIRLHPAGPALPADSRAEPRAHRILRAMSYPTIDESRPRICRLGLKLLADIKKISRPNSRW